MQLWRIANKKWALDRTGQGAANEGGRWNPVGMPAIYAGGRIEICALEKLVHLGRGTRHPTLSLVSIELPSDATIFRPELGKLPSDWNSLSTFDQTQIFGAAWLTAGEHLAIALPSVVVPEAQNFVVNPMHPLMKAVRIEFVREFRFDGRLV